MNLMEETFVAIASALNFLGGKEVIETVIGTEIVIETILEDIVILIPNALIATVMVTGLAIVLKNETKESAIIVGNLDISLENVPNEKLA